ncbi:hypothetical protein A1Q2_03777 [Trichosporon asahii var. asahii CBS 8904]|uniref:Alpha-methylacyl-CoA racemase n=1 Tax=Trichosporon asahii var. asahii (strain CBS 8904) TaxID=1220162 RepID=K1VYR7_TRIAC|nr:hypothetical protein A1Q2_03777 [Trichosporon asahii var. asahii CBS 8904]
MLLADAGATVLRVDRASPAAAAVPTKDMLARHKQSVVVDLKQPAGVALVKKLAERADVLIDPFRPGVLEKLGLGPKPLLEANPKLIYARMTGFRRDGKYSAMAGHDINYLAVSGVLSMLGRAGDKPHPPTNILGDFAGGGAVLFQGILLALLSRGVSGKGQVVEANMVDGASYLSSMPRMGQKTPLGAGPRGTNMLDGGCPFYDTYETRDGKYVAVGSLEPQFFREMIKGTGLDPSWAKRQQNLDEWDTLRQQMTEAFKSKTRAEWEKIFDGTDACVTPVLEYSELEGKPEGDQRPIVTLRNTPLLAVTPGANGDPAKGQGPGVKGAGYSGNSLTPGEGGPAAINSWLGWDKGTQWEEVNGGYQVKQGAKL